MSASAAASSTRLAPPSRQSRQRADPGAPRRTRRRPRPSGGAPCARLCRPQASRAPATACRYRSRRTPSATRRRRPPASSPASPSRRGGCRAATRVVIVRARRRGGGARPVGAWRADATAAAAAAASAAIGRAAVAQTAVAVPNGIVEEDEDTGNDSFYSAAEERVPAGGAADEDEEEGTDLSDVQSVSSTLDDLSDDPDEVISLNAPLLPPQTSGILSSFNAATPRALGFHSTGIATPGSVHSSFSTSTMRAGAGRGKVFKSRGLLRRVPDDLLHPRPSIEDDEEARIFVDTSALVKIGCFSGDWVRIESAPEPRAGGLGLVPWAHDAFRDDAAEKPDWRPVKVYGLPDARKTVVRPMPSTRHVRKSSFLDFGPRNTPAVYAPPVLLANMSNPQYIRISPLSSYHQPHVRPSSASKRQRLTSSSMPPVASQVNMLKILTPLSQDIQLQSILFAALKDYFDGKRRIIKPGDLVAIEFDEKLGRSMHGSSNETPDDLLFEKRDRTNVSPPARKNSVAWFKVATVVAESVKAEDGTDECGGSRLCGSVAGFNNHKVDAKGDRARQAAANHGRDLAVLSRRQESAGILGASPDCGTNDSAA